ncbi:MAG: CHAP domain-containing protein [Crocinitomicaceae bacterium]
MIIADKIITIAITQLGVTEVPLGSNAGPDVEKYLKSVGLGKGYSWCMAFVYWVVSNAAKESFKETKLKKTAGVLDQWNSRPGLRLTTPVPGCIFIMDFGHGQGHTGIVEKVLQNGMITTIEGNTNDDGSREGIEVCRRTRNVKNCKGFLNTDV